MAAITANTGSNNWNTNGAWVGGVQPTAADDVTIPATAVVTIPSAVTALCRSCTVQASGTLAFAATTSVLTIGDATAGSGNVAFSNSGTITLTAVGTINFISTSATVQTVTTGGQTMPNQTFNAASNGSWQLADSNSTASATTITLTKGTLNTNGQTCSWGLFSSNNSNTRTLTLGASAITISGASTTIWDMATSTGLTLSANTSTITMTGTAPSFRTAVGFNMQGASLVFNGTGLAFITNSLTCANLTRTGTATSNTTLDNFALTAGMTVTVTGTFTATGQSSVNRLLCCSGTIGSSVTINAASTSFANVDFQDTTAAGAGNWDVSTALLCPGLSGNCGGNSGITFCLSTTQQWSGTSGGNASANAWTSRVPLAHDDVTFNTAFTANQTITQDIRFIGRNIDFTGVTGNALWTTTAANCYVTGNIIIAAGQSSFMGLGSFLVLWGRGSQTLTTAGKTYNCNVMVAAPGGSYTLNDAFRTQFGIVHQAGTFNSAGFAVTTAGYSMSGVTTKTLTFGGSQWTLASTSGSSFTPWTSNNTLTVSDTPNIVVAETDARIKNGALRYDQTTQSCESAFYCARPAASTLTGDLEIIMRVNPDTWTPGNAVYLCGIRNNTAESGVVSGQEQWSMGLSGSNQIALVISTTGTGATTYGLAHGFAAGAGEKWIKVTRVQSSGTITIYTAAATGNNTLPSWTLLGTVAGTTSAAFNSTSPLFVGNGINTNSNANAATIYYTTVASAVGGTPVATFDPTGRADGTISFTDAQSNVWIAHQTGDRSVARIAGGRVILPNSGANCLSTPTSAALEITGDIDIRCDLMSVNYSLSGNQHFISKPRTDNTPGYYFRVAGPSQQVNFNWKQADGTSQSTIWNTTFSGGSRQVLRVTLQVNNGVGGSVVKFYTGTSITGPWTLKQTTTNGFTTDIGSNLPGPLYVGMFTPGSGTPLNGHIFRAQIRNNINDDGTGIVFDFDPSTVQDHSMVFKEKSSNAAIVTVNQSGRTSKTWSQATGTVPGTATFEGGGGGSVTFASATTSVGTLPTVSIPQGRTVLFTAGHLFKVPSWTQTTTATAAANALLSTTAGTAGFLPMSGTTGPTVNYVGIRDNNISVLPPATFSDNFTRADSTNNLGNTSTGQTWVQSGGTWGISSNKMYQSAGSADSTATFDSGLTDVDVRMVISVLPAAGSSALAAIARYVDNNNFYYATVNSTGASCGIGKRVAGVNTTLGSTVGSFVAGDEVGLRVYGTTIEFLHNGNVRVVATDSSLAVGTKVGVAERAVSDTTWRASSFRAGAPQFGTATEGFDAGNNNNWNFTTTPYSNPYWIPRPRVY